MVGKNNVAQDNQRLLITVSDNNGHCKWEAGDRLLLDLGADEPNSRTAITGVSK